MTYILSRRNFMRRTKDLALATPFLSLAGCGDSDVQRKLSVIQGETMGTTYSVKIPDLPSGIDQSSLATDIERLLELVNAQMSTYRPDSELSRFNDGPVGAWSPVSADTLKVVDAALRVSQLAGGAFDPTIGPLVDLWGFGPGGDKSRVPQTAHIQSALDRIGYAHVATDSAASAIGKRGRDVRIDLSGIAKGFGVDKVAGHLDSLGIQDYLVDIGGELRGRGRNAQGALWRVGIEKPKGAPGTVQSVVQIDGHAIATSGDYRIFFESDGQRFSHIVNPKTGRPVDHGLASATVVAETSMLADALSTALLVLGPEAGLELAKREGIAAHFIARTEAGFDERTSPAFAKHLVS